MLEVNDFELLKVFSIFKIRNHFNTFPWPCKSELFYVKFKFWYNKSVFIILLSFGFAKIKFGIPCVKFVEQIMFMIHFLREVKMIISLSTLTN